MVPARIKNILTFLIVYALFDFAISLKYKLTRNFENDEKLFFILFDIFIFILSDLIGALFTYFYTKEKTTNKKKQKSNLLFELIYINEIEELFENNNELIIFLCIALASIETIIKCSDIFLFKYVENGIVKEYGMAWYIGFDYCLRILCNRFIFKKQIYKHQKLTSMSLLFISFLLGYFYKFIMENIFNQSLSLVQIIVIILKIFLIPLKDSVIKKLTEFINIPKILFARGIVSLFLFTIFSSILIFRFKFIEWANIFSWKGILFLICWPFLYPVRSINLISFIYHSDFTYFPSLKFPLLIRNYLIFKDNYNNMYLHLFYILYFIIVLFFILIIIEIASLNFLGFSKFNALEIMKRGEQDTFLDLRNPSDFSVIPGEQGNEEQEDKEQENI